MHRPVVVAVLALATTAAAQFRPLPAIPVTAPPTPHPAYAAQPLFDMPSDGSSATGGGSPSQPGTAAGPASPPETSGPKVAGRDLKKAGERVTNLKWFEDLGDARARAAALNRPILWIQALGELEGFA